MGRYGIYGVKVGASVIGGITAQSLKTGSELRAEASSGEVYARFVSMVAQRPMAAFTTRSLASFLAAVGTLYKTITTAAEVDLYAQQWADGATRSSGSLHRRFRISKGLLIPRTLSGAHQQDATISAEVLATYDGVNNPIAEYDNQALPAVTDAERFAFYKAVVGGVTLDEEVSVSISFGARAAVEGKRSEIWDRFASVSDILPIISLRSKNIDLLKSTNIPLVGKAAAHANTVVYLIKRASGSSFVPLATAEHIALSAAGMGTIGDVMDANGNSTGECSLDVTCVFDGTNTPILANYASAIV